MNRNKKRSADCRRSGKGWSGCVRSACNWERTTMSNSTSSNCWQLFLLSNARSLFICEEQEVPLGPSLQPQPNRKKESTFPALFASKSLNSSLFSSAEATPTTHVLLPKVVLDLRRRVLQPVGRDRGAVARRRRVIG